MKIPTFQEISLNNYSVAELVESLKLQEAGLFPTYIILNTATIEATKEALDNLALAFAQLNINPKFPYPFYAITEKVSFHKSIPICSSVKALPAHFNRSAKRLKGRELALLNRANLLKDKVVNIPFYERITNMNKSMKGQRELYRMTKKLNFYEELLNNLDR